MFTIVFREVDIKLTRKRAILLADADTGNLIGDLVCIVAVFIALIPYSLICFQRRLLDVDLLILSKLVVVLSISLVGADSMKKML